MQREDWQLYVNYIFGCVLISIFLAVPILVRASQRWGEPLLTFWPHLEPPLANTHVTLRLW